MKKIFGLTLLLSLCFIYSRAQQPVRKGALETVTISVPTVQCDECKDRIEKYLTREDGITLVKVDYKKKNMQSNLLLGPEHCREH